MFKYDLSYINLIHLSKVSINEKKLTVRYFWDGRIESQTFADQSEFDAAVDSDLRALIKRADAFMYENKKASKSS